MAHRAYSLYTNGSGIISFHIANMPNRMLLQSEHIPCIPVVLKRSVCTCQTCQTKFYCTPNIYLIYKCCKLHSPMGSHGVHMESMLPPQSPCGLHVYSMLPPQSPYGLHLDSMWTPPGLHVDSTWTPCIFHGLHMDFMCIQTLLEIEKI